MASISIKNKESRGKFTDRRRKRREAWRGVTEGMVVWIQGIEGERGSGKSRANKGRRKRGEK